MATMNVHIPSYTRRYQKRKERIDYYLNNDPNGFRQLMQQLACGYTGFMFPLERTDSKKFHRYRRFELATFEQREQMIDKIYASMRRSKMAMLRAKRMWQQLLRQLKRERIATTIAPGSIDLRIETKEHMFQIQLTTFLQQHNSLRTIDDMLTQLLSNRSMFDALYNINDEFKRWTNQLAERNSKQRQDGEKLFKLVDDENDLQIRFKLLTKLIRIGDDEQVVQAYWQRMLVCMQASKYLTAAHDLDILLSQVCQQKSEHSISSLSTVNASADVRLSQQLFYYAVKCYYRLLTNPSYQSLGSLKRENHLQRYQQLIRELQLLAYFDYSPNSEQQRGSSSQIIEFMRGSNANSILFRSYGSVLRRLKREGLPIDSEDVIKKLRNQQIIQGIPGQKQPSMDDDLVSISMDTAKAHQEFAYSDIFAAAHFNSMDGRYLCASRPIQKGETIFYEKIVAFSVKRMYWKKYCAYCRRRLSHHFIPCSMCSESVFCNVVCERMAAATSHPRTCTLSTSIIYEHFNNDHIVALVYDLFASLPIRLIIDASRVDVIRAYDHGLRYPVKLPFMMTVFTQLMLDLPYSTIGQIDLQLPEADDCRKMLFDSIRLAMIIAHKFRLSRLDMEAIRSVNEENQSIRKTSC
ncbi:hypothetical protein HUG17_7336 [Dermatophagoides farinae]|uniref:MYND-type domain-containing protein n=1 Tax=Dermatophagoides farinae TaxID=6954 RepID=A0A9D4NSV5_DERFA|nr:hypothetical protein HUG17_7336 [Dermatophagoides farinae]